MSEKTWRSRLKELKPPVPAIMVLFFLAVLGGQVLGSPNSPLHVKVLMVLLEFVNALAMFLFYQQKDPGPAQ